MIELTKFADLSVKVEKYYSLAHSIGNFMPVPTAGCFNPKRGFDSTIHDYFDLTLEYIYQWFVSKEPQSTGFYETLNQEANRKWLNSFGEGKKGWIKFVDAYFLQMYVNEDYKPIPLWANHTHLDADDNIIKLKTKKLSKDGDIETFLDSAIDRIVARGKYMIEKLRGNDKAAPPAFAKQKSLT